MWLFGLGSYISSPLSSRLLSFQERLLCASDTGLYLIMLEGTSGIKEEKDKVAKQIVSTSNMYRLFRAAPIQGGWGVGIYYISSASRLVLRPSKAPAQLM